MDRHGHAASRVTAYAAPHVGSWRSCCSQSAQHQRENAVAYRLQSLIAGVIIMLPGCTAEDVRDDTDAIAADTRADTVMAPLAEQYVKLVLSVGTHADGYVDAYYGPAEWQEQAAAEQPSLDSIARGTERLIAGLRGLQ